MTTALTALFAACSNEDFLDNAQNQIGAKDARPTVDNVEFNVVGDGSTDTRMQFGGGGYQWQSGDVIGALLMDEVVTDKRPNNTEEWSPLTWTQRYKLVDYINTNYPFTRKANGTWSSDAKMLEGNYFFTFPFASYSGNREAIHNLEGQVQKGATAASRAEAYAKNQFFVGYSRIFAGTESGDVMSSTLQMVPVLGAVKIDIKNVSERAFTVKKIVLASEDFHSVIKIDPTTASYKGENGEATGYQLDDGELTAWGTSGKTYFNYANYEEGAWVNKKWQYADKFTQVYEKDGELVNNTEKSPNYNPDAALRAVIKGTYGEIEGDNNRVELLVEGVEPIKNGETQSFIVMANEYEFDNDSKNPNHIYASIYTDQGLIKDVVISNVNKEVTSAGKGVTVISDNPIVKISPEIGSNVVSLEVDNNSIQPEDNMDIYNESDLAQLIEWNKGLKRVFTAELKNDVVLTKEMSDNLLKAEWANAYLKVEGSDKSLIIAKDAAANILNRVIVEGEGVEVRNALTLDAKSFVPNTNGYTLTAITAGKVECDYQLTIAEGASVTVNEAINAEGASVEVKENNGTLNINKAVEALTVTENKAEMNINAEVKIAKTSENKPGAVVNVSESGKLRADGQFTNKGAKSTYEINYAVINNDGEIYNLVNGDYGKVIAGKGENVYVQTETSSAATSVVDITANIKSRVSQGAGIIAYTVTGTNTVKEIADAKVTELTIDGGKVIASKKDETGGTINATVKVTENGGSIDGDNVSTIAEDVEVNGALTIKNVTVQGDIAVKAGTTTVEGTVDASGRTITLASYDASNYKVNNATLLVKGSLKADAIVKDSNAKVQQENAKVDNQNAITLKDEDAKAAAENQVTWSGNKAGTVAAPAPDLVPADVTLEEGTTISNLYELQEAINNLAEDNKTLKTIYIDSKISLNDEITVDGETVKNGKYASVFAGRDVVIRANLYDVDPSYNVTMNSLKVEGNNITIGSGKVGYGDTFLTVNSFDYSGATGDLTINRGFIEVNVSAQTGTTTGVTAGSAGVTLKGDNGKLVAKNAANSALKIEWDFTAKKWAEWETAKKTTETNP